LVEVEIYAGHKIEYNAMKQEFQVWKDNTKIFSAKTQREIEDMIDGKETKLKFKRCLHMDWDFRPTKGWIRKYLEVIINTYEYLGYKVEEVIMKKRGRGFHIWVHIISKKPFTEDEVNMLQWIGGDDITRVRINRYRTRRGMKMMWNKLFSRVIWRKDLPKNCQKCRIVKTLRELEQGLEKEEGEYPEVVRFRPGIDDVNELKIMLGEKK
jgi:hypothetical protein